LDSLLVKRKGSVLKKLIMLAALLAMLIVAAVPAIAQIGQEAEQETESGDISQDASSTQEGDNSIQCVNDQLVGNTGNAQTQNQAIQYASEGSASPSGNATITVNPNEDVDDVYSCTAEVNQAASASG
jgi:predicted PurR-regulated permease PerM